MKRQQESFATMRKNEENEIKKMEEAEQKRLEAYQAKKNLERSRREAKKVAHKSPKPSKVTPGAQKLYENRFQTPPSR